MVNTQRITAQKSVVTLRFNLNTAQSGVYAIPAGTRVSDGTTMFATNELAEIPEGETTIDVVATSTVEGSYTNNIKAGAINTVVDLLPNLESVENINQPSGGADTETDEAYAQRIHLQAQAHPPSPQTPPRQLYAQPPHIGLLHQACSLANPHKCLLE